MVRDAETHAEEDKKRRAVVDARVEAERQVHSAEKALADYGSKVSQADRSAIETAIADVRTAIESDDAENITAKTAALAQAAMKLGEAMYQQSAGGDTGPASGTGAKDDDVVDADFEEVDDDERKRSA